MAGGSGGPPPTPQATSSRLLLLLPALQAPFPLFPPLSCLLIHPCDHMHGAFLDYMFYPLSPAKQPYYINLLSFPVT